ncbi:hypothetical protein SBBP1_110075 [Burkholderiales bacterium]|nr:hypothetical protein SBBP1_110075 [Burkholderiales bacterium]
MVVKLASKRSRQDAVLLLHGLSGSPLEMQYLERRMREAGFLAHNPSIPGCGFGTREDRFDTGTWRQWVAFVSGELDALSHDHERVYVAGLCIGAVLALRLAIERPQQVAGLALVSTTLAYDGWQMPWYRVLAPLAYHTPLRRMIAWPERPPYGLKNERLREWVVLARGFGGRIRLPAALRHPRGAPVDRRRAPRHFPSARARLDHACNRG